MPLRDLFYISSEYQKLVDDTSIYSSKLQKIPAPSFIVFYNGIDQKKDKWINYLSDAYENLTGDPNLELKVITLNINDGHNKALMEQCHILKDYAQYVARVRKNAKENPLDVAVKITVNQCIHEGILADFLRANRAEVIAMSIFEYDKEEEERKLRRAEYEAGLEDGRIEGITVGKNEAIQQAVTALSQYGMPPEQISATLKISLEDVRKWLEEK